MKKPLGKSMQRIKSSNELVSYAHIEIKPSYFISILHLNVLLENWKLFLRKNSTNLWVQPLNTLLILLQTVKTISNGITIRICAIKKRNTLVAHGKASIRRSQDMQTMTLDKVDNADYLLLDGKNFYCIDVAVHKTLFAGEPASVIYSEVEFKTLNLYVDQIRPYFLHGEEISLVFPAEKLRNIQSWIKFVFYPYNVEKIHNSVWKENHPSHIETKCRHQFKKRRSYRWWQKADGKSHES